MHVPQKAFPDPTPTPTCLLPSPISKPTPHPLGNTLSLFTLFPALSYWRAAVCLSVSRLNCMKSALGQGLGLTPTAVTALALGIKFTHSLAQVRTVSCVPSTGSAGGTETPCLCLQSWPSSSEDRSIKEMPVNMRHLWGAKLCARYRDTTLQCEKSGKIHLWCNGEIHSAMGLMTGDLTLSRWAVRRALLRKWPS